MFGLAIFFLGALSFLCAVAIINRISIHKKLTRRASFWASGESVLHLNSAGIATDLAPLSDGLDLSGAVVTIVGGDGSYLLSKRGNQLRRMLSEWARAGATIEYILLASNDDVQDAFIELSKKIQKEGKGRLSIFRFPNSENLDNAELGKLELKEKFLEMHPTLFVTKHGPAIWLERLHPAGSLYAYNVTFVAPQCTDAKYTEIFKEIAPEVERLKQMCSKAAA